MSLRFAILGLLDYTPMTGYHLSKLFNKSINNIWTASLSQIYRELSYLEKEGFVTSHIEEQEDRPDKKVYSVTEGGKKAFLEWLSQCPDSYVSPKRDEFMLKILFGSSLGKDGVRCYLERFIQDRQRAIKELNGDTGEFTKISKILGNEFMNRIEQDRRYIQFILRRAIMMNKLLIEWARDCIKELEEF